MPKLVLPHRAKAKRLRLHPSMLSDQALTPRKAAPSLPFWDVGRDKSEGLNRRIYRIQAQAYNSYHFPSFHAQTEGIPARFVWIRRCSFHQQLLPGTLTFSVYEDEEVSKECLPWSVLSNSVLSFACCIASEDLDRPNAWRHHESETNVQTEDVLQATHWMHSMTTHTRGIMWKIIESRSHGWRCCFHKQMLSNFVSSKRPFPRCKRLSLPKRLTHRCPPRDGSVWFASPLRAIFQRLAVKRFQAQPHANWTCFWWWC